MMSYAYQYKFKRIYYVVMCQELLVLIMASECSICSAPSTTIICSDYIVGSVGMPTILSVDLKCHFEVFATEDLHALNSVNFTLGNSLSKPYCHSSLESSN